MISNKPMPKFYFYFSAMNAGKTTALLQSNFNYIERGMTTLIFVPNIIGSPIRSRIGLESSAIVFTENFDFIEYMKDVSCDCVFIDEAQFLTRKQVIQLGKVVDIQHTPVLCYGIRTDFRGELFEGSGALLGIADIISEIKTICSCGKKAIMNMRIDLDGNAIRDGNQIDIGGNDKYVTFCRKCYYCMI
jgi:thymidine kinase